MFEIDEVKAYKNSLPFFGPPCNYIVLKTRQEG